VTEDAVAARQATVATFDPDTGAGTVLLDDGRAEAFDGTAFAAGGLRLLRLGQRVRLEYAGGRVVRVTIATLP
jgi:cold shock CspA family protein